MKTIEIVTHCYSGDEVPIYHHLLRHQLASLAEVHKDGIEVTLSVYFNRQDMATVDVLKDFVLPRENRDVTSGPLRINPCHLEKEALFRRAIGRNRAACLTSADVVWFTDVDYCFFRDSLKDAYYECLGAEENMVFPQYVNIHEKHEYGDELINDPSKPIDLTKFVLRREKRAIGGIQIVKGDWCRKNGYLKGTKWTKGVDPSQGFRSCKGDVPFRKQVGPSKAAAILDVYRIRHSRAGRDGGTVDHGAKTK